MILRHLPVPPHVAKSSKTSNLLTATNKTPSKLLLTICWQVPAKSNIGKGLGTACDGTLDEAFSQGKTVLLICPSSSLFSPVYVHSSVCLCVAVPDLAALQTSTDVSGGSVGSHSIEEAPGSIEAFSLPLGSVWSAQQYPPLPFSIPAP